MTFWKILWRKHGSTSRKIRDKPNGNSKTLIQDFHHEGKKIDIVLNKDKNINLQELEELCDTVGWVRRPLKKVKMAIKHSFLTISLSYSENKNKRLIGFARATSDNTFNATIWDVVVHPKFQRNGLGRILINEIVKELRYSDINTITLFADPHVLSFYKSLGFIPDPDGIKGMFWYPNSSYS